MSNSKLNPAQAAFRKQFKRVFPEVQFFSYPDEGVTVGIRQTSPNMGEFAVSIASDTEKKFRRKVGEYHVAVRFDYAQTLPVRLKGYTMETVAGNIMLAVW